jgi:hypothetical protein
LVRTEELSMNRQEASEIYQALRVGRGHDRVTEANVEELIVLAKENGDAQTEVLLREWRSPCGDDPAMPAIPQKVPGASGQDRQ